MEEEPLLSVVASGGGGQEGSTSHLLPEDGASGRSGREEATEDGVTTIGRRDLLAVMNAVTKLEDELREVKKTLSLSLEVGCSSFPFIPFAFFFLITRLSTSLSIRHNTGERRGERVLVTIHSN